MVAKTEYYILIENAQTWALNQQDNHGPRPVTSSVPEELSKLNELKWRTGLRNMTS